MKTVKYVYWQDEGMWPGYLQEYPDYWTQGETPEALEENLKDIFKERLARHAIKMLCDQTWESPADFFEFRQRSV
ncbi:hypothetical protein [Desulfoferrobacter suflitae]|uniref:hypothetical protein n=1 Tax=Desulfoferrobacter suflitae TaxID=2865782 RepID=UPI002164AFA6|nr:hypothetical protein [Desulfoferrobacter suflitae]MCK8601847.1 hypothetical protein [Desulfoferrobacter suflitae]